MADVPSVQACVWISRTQGGAGVVVCPQGPSVLRAGWEADPGGGPRAELAFLSSGLHRNDN